MAYSRLDALQRVIKDARLLEVEVLPSQLQPSRTDFCTQSSVQEFTKVQLPVLKYVADDKLPAGANQWREPKENIHLLGVLWLTALKDSKHSTAD